MDRRLIAIISILAALGALRGGTAQEPATAPAPLDEPAALPPPTVLPAPDDPGLPSGPAPLDDDVIRVGDKPAGLPGVALQGPADPIIFAAENLPTGPQSVALTVEVESPAVASLNKEAVLAIRVKNIGKTDARGVVVRDVMPEGLEFIDGFTPQPARNGQMLTWTLDSLAAGTERVLKFKARPTKVGPLDHAATVSLRAGAKSRTVVQQPKLKVEVLASTTKVLKGKQVQFKVTVSNPGTGPARKVLVQARLSGGLKHPVNSKALEMELQEIRPNESVTLEALILDAIAGGVQTCEIIATSPDVVASAEDPAGNSARAEVEVIEPLLNLALSGPSRAYTGQTSKFRVVVENPGTAPAQDVGVAVLIPDGSELAERPPEGRYDASTRNLRMAIPRLEPQEKVEYPFAVRLSGVQLLKLQAKAATRDRALVADQALNVDVEGLADVRILVSERAGSVLDVGDTVDFEIQVRNVGSKEARNLIVWVEPSKNLEILSTDHDGDEDAAVDKTSGKVKFPQIARLGKGDRQRMMIRAKTTAPGTAYCLAKVLHDDESEDTPIQNFAKVRVESFSGGPGKK